MKPEITAKRVFVAVTAPLLLCAFVLLRFYFANFTEFSAEEIVATLLSLLGLVLGLMFLGERDYAAGYRGQAEFLFSQLRLWVPELLARHGRNSVILIHANHGPAPLAERLPEQARQCYPNLCALYRPDRNYREFPETLSPGELLSIHSQPLPRYAPRNLAGQELALPGPGPDFP